MFNATFLGGPRDGQVIALPDGTWELRMPVAMNMREWLNNSSEPPSTLDVHEHVLKIERHNYKYVIVWKEPRVPRPPR